jgi:hypothetical protein
MLLRRPLANLTARPQLRLHDERARHAHARGLVRGLSGCAAFARATQHEAHARRLVCHDAERADAILAERRLHALYDDV